MITRVKTLTVEEINRATEDIKRHNLENLTICETLREIYSLTQDPKIQDKCIKALALAKRMDKRLRENKLHDL